MKTATAVIAGAVTLAFVRCPPSADAEPQAAGKAAVTHEALWAMKRVGSPAPSPDGKLVAFRVTEPSYEDKKDVTDLWLVSTATGAVPRRLTEAKGGDGAPSWSPDGRRLAFAAKRDDDEVSQVYVIDAAGGEAQRVTSAPLAARAPVWSPDGTWILYQASAYPGAGDPESNRRMAAERKDVKSKVRAYEGFPIRRWDKWLDDTQTHLFVVRLAGGQPRDLLAGTDLAAQPGYGGPVSEGSTEDLGPAWTPDGQSVVFAATTGRDAAAYSSVDFHLYEARLRGGEPRQLTTGHASHASPQFAPDGRSLCFKLREEWGQIYALDRLACAPWPWTGAVRTMTGDFDRSVDDFAFAPDGRIYLTAEEGGYVRLFAVGAGPGVTMPVFESRGAFGGIEVARQAWPPTIVAAWGTAVSPPEIVRVDPDAKTQTALTAFNAGAAAALDWAPLEEFWFTNEQGRRVHSFVVLPADFDPNRKYPLLVLIHGGHANMWRDQITYRWNYHLLASPGYVVLLTDYRGSTGYGEAFTLDILGDPLRGPAEDINGAADEALRRYRYIDSSRQAAGGASYGGHLANWLEATTTRYRCLISHAGLSSLQTQWSTSDEVYHREVMMSGPFWENTQAWLEQSPIAHASSFQTPMLLSVGENDYRVPMNNTLEMYTALQRVRVPVRLLVWPDENHWILKGENSRVFYKEVHDWLARWLK
jgi:dipeptidyl aminopeptidase/acylaminoacyl peptidase